MVGYPPYEIKWISILRTETLIWSLTSIFWSYGISIDVLGQMKVTDAIQKVLKGFVIDLSTITLVFQPSTAKRFVSTHTVKYSCMFQAHIDPLCSLQNSWSVWKGAQVGVGKRIHRIYLSEQIPKNPNVWGLYPVHPYHLLGGSHTTPHFASSAPCCWFTLLKLIQILLTLSSWNALRRSTI